MAGEPLRGIKVIELGHVMAGPVCGRMLADLGADVIKVEPPTGDPSRSFAVSGGAGANEAFAMLNRGKRGIVLDLKSEKGRAALRRLTNQCDVLIENFRPGVMKGMSLGFDDLRSTNAGLIYCQITGFGTEGPLGEHGGFDLIAQGMTGFLSVTGEGGDGPPVKSGPPVTDITAGILGALGVVSALFAREKSGLGQRVDTSLYQAGAFHMLWHGAIALATGQAPGALGSAHPLAAPYQAFRTSDGWITVGGSNQATWERLADAVGRPGLVHDERFVSNADRVRNRIALADLLEEGFAEATTGEWLDRLRAAKVPAGPVLSVPDMLAHPQSRANRTVIPVTGTDASTLGLPVSLSGADPPAPSPAPELGADTRAVLAEHGFSESEIASLLRTQ
ncbi:MAG: CoA transferase [Gemmatimonadetes bacterium]|nr:CoA transferase [Gemmatimonadota bacterium]NNM33549.1 CoA transferase [Gemmatimonadota bacterium]